MTEPTDHDGATGSDEGWKAVLARQSESAHPGGDPDLVSLVRLVNAFGVEQPVVLTLPGQVLAGTLVSGRTYFAGLADAVQGDEPDDTMRGALATSYRARGQDFEGWGATAGLGDLDPEGPDDDQLAALPDIAYVHLREAEVVLSPPSARRLPLWRGRLAEVVGWTVGAFEEPPSAG